MFESVLVSLVPISLVFELCALGLSFYLKDSRIFFIVLSMLCARLTYLLAPFYQAHLFVSLFLPLVFVLFVVLKKSVLVFEKKSLVKLAVLVFVGILGFVLCKSTDFNASMSEKFFDIALFTPISQVSFVFLVAEFAFLLFWGAFKGELHFGVAFGLSFLQFCFESAQKVGFFEFGTLFFVLYLVYHTYKSLYFDTFTKLPNKKALKRKLLGFTSCYLGALRVSGFEHLEPKDEKILFKKIGKILRKQAKNVKVFRVDDDFIFVFEKLDESVAREFLRALKNGFENTNSWLKNKALSLKIASALIESKEKFDENLNAIKEALAPIKRV